MGRQFRLARRMGSGGPEGAFARRQGDGGGNKGVLGIGGQLKPDLAAAGQLDIDLGEQFGVKQRPVPGTVAAVDSITGAQRVERILGPGMAHAGQGNGIDHPIARERRQAQHVKFGIDEAEVEPGIVRDQHRILQEFKQVGRLFMKPRLVRKESGGQAMDRLGRGRHIAIRVEIAVEGSPGGHPVDHLDTTDFDQPVTALGIKTGGFGIEDYLTHLTRISA